MAVSYWLLATGYWLLAFSFGALILLLKSLDSKNVSWSKEPPKAKRQQPTVK
jgi:hypothetical protein